MNEQLPAVQTFSAFKSETPLNRAVSAFKPEAPVSSDNYEKAIV